MSNITKQGIINTIEFIESPAITNQFSGNASASYTPTTGTNSCMSMGKWMVPEDTVGGDTFHITLIAQFNGFDTSNTSGTFRLLFQGTNYTTPTSAAWQGTNYICSALNNFKSLTTTVLSATSGTFLYETNFIIPQSWLDTPYYGSQIGVRSDYSNGTGVLTIKNIRIIPAKYSTTETIPKTNMRIGNDFVTTNEFIEW